MDEKTFQRIIPVIIAVIVLIIQYVIKNQKKKNAASASTKVPEFEEIVFQKEEIKPAVERVQTHKKANPNKVVTELNKNENASEFKKITYQTVKQTMKQNMKQNIKSSFQSNDSEIPVKKVFLFNEEEIKKAVIYSEILTPKHF